MNLSRSAQYILPMTVFGVPLGQHRDGVWVTIGLTFHASSTHYSAL